jgi:adenylate cyclase
MNIEIERKFLVQNDDWRKFAVSCSDIRQVYLDMNPKVSIRIRIRDSTRATLTVKSSPSALRRLELEYPIPTFEAEALMPLRQGTIVEKTRHIIPCGELAWEVDEFAGVNGGLVIAEIELPSEHHPIERPGWIGPEVTGQRQYYNGSLAMRPFSQWARTDQRARTDERR